MAAECGNGPGGKMQAHMARRRGHGLTYKQLGDDFGTSKSTAHRKLNTKNNKKSAKTSVKAAKSQVKGDDMARGYTGGELAQ